MVLLSGLFMVPELLSLDDGTKALSAKLTNSEDFLEMNTGIRSICPVIERAGAEDGATVLIIGDSIAGQLFNRLGDNDNGVTVCCANAAINITGQYMLAKTFLDSHPEATDIWLFMHPLTLTRTYDMNLGYGYSVMPFVETGLIDELDSNTIDQMASVYGRIALSREAVDLIERSPLNRKLFLNYIMMHNEEYHQSNAYEISEQYILKLRDLCDERGVAFHFYSSPSTEYYRESNEDTRADFEMTALYELYPDYLDSIYYFPTEWSEDMTHFGYEYASEDVYDEVIRDAYEDFNSEIYSYM